MKIEAELKLTKPMHPVSKAYLNIMFTSGWLRNKISKELKPYKLTPEQYNVMRIINGQPLKAICIGDIAHRMIDRNSNASRIVDKLVVKKLAVRNQSEHDRRQCVVSITDTGKDMIKAVEKKFTIGNSNLSNLTEEDAELINSILDKLRS